MATRGKTWICNNFIQYHRCQNSNRCFTNLSNGKLLQNPQHWIPDVQCRGFRPNKSLPPGKNVVDGRLRKLINPFGFTIVVCGCSFTGAMIWQYETMRAQAKRIQNMFNSSTNGIMYPKMFGLRRHVSSWWNSVSSGEKMVLTIIGLNVGVFLLWKVPFLQSFLKRYFASSPFKGHSVMSLFLSIFSHPGFLHLFTNMYVFLSFSPMVLQLLQREQMCALYCSGGVISSFASCIYKIVKGIKIPSLGASGAVMTILGLSCMEEPDAQLTIAFIGDFLGVSFTAKSGLIALLTVDTLGLIMGWKLLDHAGHLGGVLFGIWYARYGKNMIWDRREKVMRHWHSIRQSVK